MTNELKKYENVDNAIDYAEEVVVLIPLERELGPYAIPCRKVGEILGDTISKSIDKIFI